MVKVLVCGRKLFIFYLKQLGRLHCMDCCQWLLRSFKAKFENRNKYEYNNNINNNDNNKSKK